jgi:uncharacterized membrane-anchored protein YitT (DUF2179 family)
MSLGQSILFNMNASSGGLDIVAMILHKYLKMPLGSAMSGAGVLIALSSFLVYDSKTAILSLIGTYLNVSFSITLSSTVVLREEYVS